MRNIADEDEMSAFGLPGVTGVLVLEISAGSVPAKAGLQKGDLVLALNGATQAYRARTGVAGPAVTNRLAPRRADARHQVRRCDRPPYPFTTTLSAGSHHIAPVVTLADGNELGAYSAIVTFVR